MVAGIPFDSVAAIGRIVKFCEGAMGIMEQRNLTINEWLLQEARTWPGAARFLDLGCGNGETAIQLASAELIEPGPSVCGDRFLYYGIDDNEKNIELAQEKLSTLLGSPTLRFYTYDLPKAWEFSAKKRIKFDFVLLREVLEHRDDPIPVLRAALESLAPTGKLYIIWGTNPSDENGERIALPERLGIPNISHVRWVILSCIYQEYGRKVKAWTFPEADARGESRQVWIIS